MPVFVCSGDSESLSDEGPKAETRSPSPLPGRRERRGSRSRRRLLSGLTVDTELAASAFGDGDDPPVIDTTSVEVERKPDGERYVMSQILIYEVYLMEANS